MSTPSAGLQRTGPPPGGKHRLRNPADRAYRWAGWSLALYPASFVAAFVVGEGIIAALTDDPDQATLWQVLVAGTPALLVFVLPGILAVTMGRTAKRLGRADGAIPATIGAVIGIGFVGLNVASYLVGRVLG